MTAAVVRTTQNKEPEYFSGLRLHRYEEHPV